MSAQPAGVAGPSEGFLAGDAQYLHRTSLDEISELAGSTEFNIEAYRRALLDSLSVLVDIQRIPALWHLGLGASFSWRPGESVVSIRPSQQVEETFRHLAERWRTETMFQSSPTAKFMHPLYLQIIGMGRDIVPLLLREVQEESGQWFLALRSITREDPVKPEEAGQVRKMAESWLCWAREQGYSV